MEGLPRERLFHAQSVGKLNHDLLVFSHLPDLGHLFSGKDTPDLMQIGDIVLLKPGGRRKHNICQLGGRCQEEIRNKPQLQQS